MSDLATLATVLFAMIGGAIRVSTPFLFVSLGECVTEKSGRINLGTTTLAMIDTILGCLRAAGFSYVQADHIWNALDSVTFGFHLLERTFPLKPDQYAEAAHHFLPLIDPIALPHMHALSTMVADGRHDGLNDFGFVLDRLLQALDALPRLG
jgi:hypothetical protein